MFFIGYVLVILAYGQEDIISEPMDSIEHCEAMRVQVQLARPQYSFECKQFFYEQ